MYVGGRRSARGARLYESGLAVWRRGGRRRGRMVLLCWARAARCEGSNLTPRLTLRVNPIDVVDGEVHAVRVRKRAVSLFGVDPEAEGGRCYFAGPALLDAKGVA